MATVSSFESLDHPAKTDLKQFSLLFQPLFQASTQEARREAVAALSQSRHVPVPVALFIASQPLAVAAPFLVSSPCLSDELLITIARSQGRDHAHAIMQRENLSATVIDALVGLRYAMPVGAEFANRQQPADTALSEGVALDMTDLPDRPALPRRSAQGQAKSRPQPQTAAAAPAPAPDDGARLSREREERLRQTIKALDRHLNRPDHDRLGARALSETQAALLVRFARAREADHFATTLADALTSSRWLVERIMLDMSGRQLATALMGLAMDIADIIFILTGFFPDLAQMENGEPGIARLLASMNGGDCEARLEAWLRADAYTYETGNSEALTSARGSAAEKTRSSGKR
ncbi:DUF2336 domain-containing protein [Allorhizobium undicola]|uniref:DUF2336 domain-containing protein n=1 Tax=Allorhizobium undicola TaxID=78527 RepID=UPI000684AD73|nr:DUF2336 domain-containing protein [Allorhizobium undicola]